MDWEKLGSGTADAGVYGEVLTRAGLPVTPPSEEWTLGALVAMLSYEPKNKPFLVGDPTIPSEAQGLLDLSPARALDARWLLRELAPCHDPRFEGPDVIGGCYGCKTDAIADFGRVYSSKTSLVGFVEGIVSSLANWKVYACGMTHHVWTDELITVSPDATFAHPLRPEEAVSAGSVIHTMYCAAHLLEWYKHVLLRAPLTKGAQYRRNQWAARVSVGVAQLDLILPHATVDGAAFLTALQTWGAALIQEEV